MTQRGDQAPRGTVHDAVDQRTNDLTSPSPGRRSTLHDVAAAVGVSPRTVSRVVNDQGGFSEATRRRVLDAVDRLAYRPNVHARGLISGRSGSIGFLVPVLSDPFFPELAEGVQRAADDAGLGVLLAMSDTRGVTQTEALTTLEGHHLDGLVVFPTGDLDTLTPFLDRGVRIVTVDTVVDHVNARSVLADLEGGTRAAVAHLVERGCRKLAMLAGADVPADRRRRRTTFLECVPDGLDHVVLDVAPDLDGGRAGARRLADEHPDVDGVFAYNDMMAIGAIQAFQELGRSIPGDVAVVGCDDISVAAGITPSLSTIRIDRNRLGEEAVRVLRELADGSAPRDSITLPVELVVRQST